MNRDLVQYRLERAAEALADAELLAQEGRNRSSVNRMYYALYYGASALLVIGGHDTSKHTGVRAILNREFVKTGKLSKEAGAIYGEIYGHRHRGDYVDYIEFADGEVLDFLKATRACLTELRRAVAEAS